MHAQAQSTAAGEKRACTARSGRGLTCDFEPHGHVGGLRGDDAHHVGHRVAFHDGEAEGRLLEEQRRRVGRQRRLGDPLDVQAAGGGLLGTPVVHGFDLGGGVRERSRTTSHDASRLPVTPQGAESVREGAERWTFLLATSR